MKRIYNYLHSMRFGILLLLLIAACSVVGTVIPQGREAAWYAQNYTDIHATLLTLGLDRVFQGWFFITLLVLLCLNLSLCSILRVRGFEKSGDLIARAAALPSVEKLDAAQLETVRKHLLTQRCREQTIGTASVYSKNLFGRYGTFLTHLAILLTVIFGAAALYAPAVVDRSCLPGEALEMEDGTRIEVQSFHIENELGELDYESVLRVTLPDGRQSDWQAVSVNHPLSFGHYKVYQQTYGTAGSLTTRNTASGGEDSFVLTEACFLTTDGTDGLWFEALYPGYVRDEDGNYTLITSTSGSYSDPVYQILLAVGGDYTPVLAFPGEELTVGDMQYTFNDPIEYPGLRIKRTPPLVNALLFLAFALMVAGLYITFFLQPVLVKTDPDGYTVSGPKPESMRMELRLLLNEKQEGV
ncbi:MAG: cytochrome c biogenesis protein ResB [Oscillospiraceae bacterium]|nr:cytochrome c biogenesis protein ResB [Oscillospiraceae bacterium]